MRQLVRLADERVKYDWAHTSHLMALIANCHRGKGSSVFHPRDFDPTRPRAERPRIGMREAVKLLVPKHKRQGIFQKTSSRGRASA